MAATTFELFIKKHAIEIPAIQRDYVQGRGFTIEDQDKREAFVSKLINAIAKEDSVQCHLEFIYGTKNEISNSFIPLDGQQRLTTLFLLHWVIWNKSSENGKEKYPLTLIEGFKYKTRISSLAFCHNIIENKLLQVEGVDTLGEQLKKQPWFSEDWIYDPTISNMISMIDFIEFKLKEYDYDENQIANMLGKLNASNNISFDELNMDDYGLSDSLYIKMNARGKQLTPFENWKSEFIKYLNEFCDEDYIKTVEGRKSQQYKDYFSHSIEHEWTDLFWKYIKEEFLNLTAEEKDKTYPCIDNMFMNLFDFLCCYYYYVDGVCQDDYTKANASVKRKIWQKKDFVDFLFKSLDSLCHIGNDDFFNKLFYICSEDLPQENTEQKVRLFRTKKCNLFRLCIAQGSTMEITDMLLFYSLLHYCNTNNVTQVDGKLKLYMRKVRNFFEGEYQNLKTRTSVQLNLRLSEFKKYNEEIKNLASKEHTCLSEDVCLIDDCAITHGNNKVFNESIIKSGEDKVVSALRSFCNASQIEKVRLLIACGFKGTYLSDCIGRRRYFFGNEGRWDVLFISDYEQISECFREYTLYISGGKDNSKIIEEAREARNDYTSGFAYYMLKYDEFINANESKFHFAINGDIDDVDWIALRSYSSNPGTAYHADPLAVAVAKKLKEDNFNQELSLYKQYKGKCPLSIVKDKVNWEPVLSVISKVDKWCIIEGSNILTDSLKNKFDIIDENGVFVLKSSKEKDMVEICVEFMKDVSTILSVDEIKPNDSDII